MLYLQNGDVYLGEEYTRTEAIKILKEKGYKKFYEGKHYLDNRNCIVGIDKNNKVGLIQRKENGLLNAKSINL